jgi:hypothetical protein
VSASDLSPLTLDIFHNIFLVMTLAPEARTASALSKARLSWLARLIALSQLVASDANVRRTDRKVLWRPLSIQRALWG